jgi:hypothetical protein
MGESAARQLEHVTLSDGRRLTLRRYPGAGVPLAAHHPQLEAPLDLAAWLQDSCRAQLPLRALRAAA